MKISRRSFLKNLLAVSVVTFAAGPSLNKVQSFVSDKLNLTTPKRVYLDAKPFPKTKFQLPFSFGNSCSAIFAKTI